MNTVEFSNHTGYGAWRGRTAPADQVADIVHGIEALGLLAKCDALLTGYVGDAALGDVVLDTARKVRAANPRAIWCCDPVLGDTDTGIYVKAGIDVFFRDRALPAADLITPNHFELEHLTGRTVATLDDALGAARSLLNRPRLALVTSLRRADADPSRSRCWRSRRRSLAHRHPVDRLRDHAQRHGRHSGGPVHGALAGKRGHRVRARQGRVLDLRRAGGDPRDGRARAAARRRAGPAGVAATTLHAREDYSVAMHVPGFAYNPIVLLVEGAIIGFLIALPVGPAAALCIRRSITAGAVAGYMTGWARRWAMRCSAPSPPSASVSSRASSPAMKRGCAASAELCSSSWAGRRCAIACARWAIRCPTTASIDRDAFHFASSSSSSPCSTR